MVRVTGMYSFSVNAKTRSAKHSLGCFVPCTVDILSPRAVCVFVCNFGRARVVLDDLFEHTALPVDNTTTLLAYM